MWFKKHGDPPNRTLIEAIKTAIKLGYRHIDAAEGLLVLKSLCVSKAHTFKVYGTEEEVGIAIKECGVPRSELFVTSKNLTALDDIPGGFKASMDRLQLEYLDLCVHW